ncbi:MAG: hypothetical protein CTY12_01475 [Methylotenera sp.]|nr:MAG: hypothetical protein CTY12_01475 [Methylotenera sp.]
MVDIIEGRNIANSIALMGIDTIETSQLVSLLELADDLYYNDEESILSDVEYDTYHQYTKSVDPTNPYFLGVGSSIRGGKVPLPYQMGSLDQKYHGEVPEWVAKHDLTREVAILSDKLDGASGMVVYDADGNFQIAYSRGDGVEGADISRHLSQMQSVPKTIAYDKPITIRGENIISKRNFPLAKNVATSRSGKPYKNARNMVSGLMNASENPTDVYDYIDFIAYEIVGSELSKGDQLRLLDRMGFLVVEFTSSEFANLTDTFLTKYLNMARADSDYELDGVVIDVNSAAKRADMNPTKTTLNPAYSIKYKVADESNMTIATVVDVEINISKHGYLKPRVEIRPVDLVGVTVTWATGFNMKFIRDNRIGPGAKIRITRSGDVIPFITNVVESMEGDVFNEWFNEKTNQFGDVRWTDTNVDLLLVDASDNATVKYQQLVDFFDSIDAPHLGEGNLQKIFDMGFETPESIIELTQQDISSLVGSTSIGKKIFTGLREKLTNIPIYKLMGSHPAFGRGIGVRKMKKLHDAWAGQMGGCESTDAIVNVEGFEIKTANKIKQGYPIFLDFLDKVERYVTIAQYEAPKIGNLSGISVIFTGFRNAALEKLVENAGGKMSTSVSSKTGLVVADDVNGSSGKLDKARKLNINIITIDELKDML